jgi:hypothetical protein
VRVGLPLGAILGLAFVALVVSEAALLVTSARRRRRLAGAVEHAAVVALASVVPLARPTPADTYNAARAEARTAHVADVVGEACHLTDLHDRCGLTLARQARLAALRDEARARGVDLPALGLPGAGGAA